eukprot:ANDGO_05991.mRNA.1 hypothetical protein H310_02276
MEEHCNAEQELGCRCEDDVDHEPDLMFLRARWANVCVDIGVSDESAAEWWSLFQQRYAEPSRHYHNWSHVFHLYALHREFAGLAIVSNSILLELCILFHDLVYDAKSKSNEEDSVVLLGEFFKIPGMNLAESDKQWVAETIRATKMHLGWTPNEAWTVEQVADTLVFLDFDMQILGSPRRVYEEYAANVRKEYSHVTDADFQRGRLAFLKSVLGASAIFRTPVIQHAFETQARANISWEVTELQQGEIQS